MLPGVAWVSVEPRSVGAHYPGDARMPGILIGLFVYYLLRWVSFRCGHMVDWASPPLRRKVGIYCADYTAALPFCNRRGRIAIANGMRLLEHYEHHCALRPIAVL